MTKDWSLVEDEARHLYSEGMSLQKLRKKLASKYDFHASTRAWRNKIKEWGVKKHRPSDTLARSRCPNCGVEPLEQQRRIPSMPISHSPVRQNPRQDQEFLNDEHAQATSQRVDGSYESPILSSNDDAVVVNSVSNILDHGMDVHGTGNEFEPSSSTAMQRKTNEAIFERVERARLDRGIRDTFGDILDNIKIRNGEESMLHYIANQGHVRDCRNTAEIILNHILHHGYPLNTLDHHGQTALEIAIKADNIEVVHELCDKDPSLARIGHREGSLLHIAVQYSSWRVCWDLVRNSGICNRKNALDMTPIQLAARRGNDDVVATLLDGGATIDSEDTLVHLIMCSRLKTDRYIDLLSRGFLRQREVHGTDSTCRSIVTNILKDDRFSAEEDMCRPILGFLEWTFRAYPGVLSNGVYNQEQIFPGFQRLLEDLWDNVSRPTQDSMDSLLRLFLQHGYHFRIQECFPYTCTPITDLPSLAYATLKAQVETCHVADIGNALFCLICSCLYNDDPNGFWCAETDVPKLLDLLQTLLNRGFDPGDRINLVALILRKTPESHSQLKIGLLKTVLRTHDRSRMADCRKYGHPLDLLARTPEPSRWRYAELLLDDDTIAQLLDADLPMEPLVLTTNITLMPTQASLSTYVSYTCHARDLQRCVLHVLTRAALARLCLFKLCLSPGDSYDRLMEILSIRQAYKLPELHLTLNSGGSIRLTDDETS